MKLLMLALLFFANTGFAMPDVYPDVTDASESQQDYIRHSARLKIVVEDQTVRFFLCQRYAGDESDKCEQFGSKPKYSLKSLAQRHGVIIGRSVATGIVEIGLVVAGGWLIYTGGTAVAGAISMAEVAPLNLTQAVVFGLGVGGKAAVGTGGVVVGSLTAGSTVFAASKLDSVNPVEQAKIADTINSQTLTGNNRKVANFGKFLKRLQIALD